MKLYKAHRGALSERLNYDCHGAGEFKCYFECWLVGRTFFFPVMCKSLVALCVLNLFSPSVRVIKASRVKERVGEF